MNIKQYIGNEISKVFNTIKRRYAKLNGDSSVSFEAKKIASDNTDATVDTDMVVTKGWALDYLAKRNGDETRTFKVANGTADNDAISKGQADGLYHPKGGVNTLNFKLKDAVADDDAPTYKQVKSMLQSSGGGGKVANYTELRAVTGMNDGDLMIVEDTLTGGKFYYDSTYSNIDDGGLYIKGWVRIIDDIVKPQWFGAIGDGSADDTVALKNCIEAVNEDRCLVKQVFLGAYTYKITDTIELTDMRGIKIFANNNGYLASVYSIKAPNDRAALKFINPDHVEISSVNVVGYGTATADGWAFRADADVEGREAFNVNNCFIKDMGAGVLINGVSYCRIDNLIIRDFSYSGIIILGSSSAIASHHAKITNCFINGGGASGFAVQFNSYSYSGYVSNTSLENCKNGLKIENNTRNFRITNCVFHGNSAQGIRIFDSGDISISSCLIDLNNGSGISFEGYNEKAIINGCQIRSNRDNGIYASGMVFLNIVGSQILDNTHSGIRLNSNFSSVDIAACRIGYNEWGINTASNASGYLAYVGCNLRDNSSGSRNISGSIVQVESANFV